MLSNNEVIAYCQRLGISSKAQEVLAAIRNVPVHPQPAGCTGQYAPAYYPSHKMAYVIHSESLHFKMAFLRELEHDNNVYEFYSPPCTITLQYEAKNGRKLSVEHTPDCFVIRKDCLGWEEWKTEEGLIQLADLQPNRYMRDGIGKWYCPPGEAVAASLGFYYRIRSFAEIDWTYQRNLLLLEDHLRTSSLDVSAVAYQTVCAFVAAHPGVTLRELLEQVAGVTSDHIYTLIAHKQIFVDWWAAPLVEPEQVCVYLEDSHAEGARTDCLLSAFRSL